MLNENPKDIYDIFELLLFNGANCRIQNNNGDTPLYFASVHDAKLHIKYQLYKYGTDINLLNNNGIFVFQLEYKKLCEVQLLATESSLLD